MKITGGLAAGLVAAVALGGCSSSSGGGGASVAPSSHSTAVATSLPPTTSPPPSPTTSPNDAACSQVQDLVFEKIKPTFQSWDVNKNEFDQRVGEQLRSEATELFSIQAQATGAAASAIEREATALTDLSIAIDEQSDSQLGAAANKGNSALAALQGTCHF